jgi:hypothetical protein
MVKEFEFYHGAAITRLIHSRQTISIRVFPDHGNASYVINEKVGLYLKYSSSRMSPWQFNFQKTHQLEIEELEKIYRNVVVGLICHDNGVVGLFFSELKIILDNTYEEVEWISASRKPRGQYSIKGKDGALLYKVSESEFVSKVLEQV